MQIFKILLEKFPESIVEHDLDQNTECLFFRHLQKTGNAWGRARAGRESLDMKLALLLSYQESKWNAENQVQVVFYNIHSLSQDTEKTLTPWQYFPVLRESPYK